MYPDRDTFDENYPNQDTFKFMQGHVIMNQPMRIVFRARETADVQQDLLIITVTAVTATIKTLNTWYSANAVTNNT